MNIIQILKEFRQFLSDNELILNDHAVNIGEVYLSLLRAENIAFNLYLIFLFFIVSLGVAIYYIYRYKNKLKRYEALSSIEDEVLRLSQVGNRLKSNYEILKNRHDELNILVGNLDTLSHFAEFGLYEPKYKLKTSNEYKEELEKVRTRQKEMIKDKTAAYCHVNWTIAGNKAKGKQSVDRTLKLALSAYNVECDNLILKVSYQNVERIKERMGRLFDRIEKLIEPLQGHISADYHALKLQEMFFVHECREMEQEEKELERERRELIREEEKAKREYDEARKNAEEEASMYAKLLSKVRKDVGTAHSAEKEKMMLEIQKLEQKLQEAQLNKERAISMAQQTKRGHVYIISNIGSFGKEVFKIGMTRRLEPMDRVKELGDASVPFIFDVHAIIYSEDAPALEKQLHERFKDKRLNRVNYRKEFFNVSLDEIKKVCYEIEEDIDFIDDADAKDYRETMAMIESIGEEIELKKKQYELANIDFELDK